VAEYTDRITAQLNKPTVTASSDPTVNNTTTHIEQASNAISDTTKKQSERIEKANIVIEKLQEQTTRADQRAANTEISYKDALVNGNKQQSPVNPSTPLAAKLRNPLNITARQILIKIQSSNPDPLEHTYPDRTDPITKIKEGANQWLANTGQPTSTKKRHQDNREVQR
jgi:hypothetical protein